MRKVVFPIKMVVLQWVYYNVDVAGFKKEATQLPYNLNIMKYVTHSFGIFNCLLYMIEYENMARTHELNGVAQKMNWMGVLVYRTIINSLNWE